MGGESNLIPVTQSGSVTGDGGDAFEEALQLTTAHRVLQLAHCFCLDLSDAFACDLEDTANFFQCVIAIHSNTKSHS